MLRTDSEQLSRAEDAVSVELHVALNKDHLPSRDAWQRAIERAGFELLLDDDFRPSDDSGYVPVRLRGAESGFEFYFDSIPDGTFAVDLGDRTHLATFRLGGDESELIAAMSAASTLTLITGGLFFDEDSGSYVSGETALQLVRSTEAEIHSRAEQRAASDAAITDRRCPECGSPCPNYRRSCKACGFALGRTP